MNAYRHAVRGTAKHIADAIAITVESLREGEVEQEPAMTDRMLGAIVQSLSGYRGKGLRWRAHTLTDRGPGAKERVYGADFMGVLTISLPDFEVSKGFLAQAKLVRPDRRINMGELRDQCEKMLELSPTSFVFLYGPNGVRVVPALAVTSSNEDPDKLYSRSAQRFFEEHFQCFIGDRRISAPNVAILDLLKNGFGARRALLIEAGIDEEPP